MITKITKGGVETNFYYNADSKRVRKTQGTASTLYFGNDFEIINNTPTLYVFAGNLRVAKVTDTDLEFYHKDHLGSTNAISREDGTIIDAGEYLPYGLDRSENDLLQSSAYKFTDQEQDAGTGLYNYDARLYDPGLGQFVMADTIVPDLFDPQSLNRYAYCLNNPLKYTDPTGHWYEGFGGTWDGKGQNSVGYNGEDGILGANGTFMSALSYVMPGLHDYAGWHDKKCDDLIITTKLGKAISNVAIVTVPAFVVISIVEDFIDLFSNNDNYNNDITQYDAYEVAPEDYNPGYDSTTVYEPAPSSYDPSSDNSNDDCGW